MLSIRQRILKREFLAGTWNTLGSPVATEISAEIGFDWVLLDQEHAPGDSMTLLDQLMAFKGTKSAPIVRIAWNDRVLFKRALDLGAAGIMVPTVETAEQARQAIDLMRYPPLGSRGVSGACRAAGYTMHFKDYAAHSAEELTTIVQIENQKGLDNLEAMAAVDGVDVLFVGPVDLSFSLGKRDQFKDPSFVAILEHVGKVGMAHGKSVGILVPDMTHVPMLKEFGYNFVAVGSEQAAVVKTLTATLGALKVV